MSLLTAYVRMLQRLQAEESLRHSTEIAVGTGSLTKDGLSSALREWREQAGRPFVEQRGAGDSYVSAWAAMGIPVTRESLAPVEA